MCEIVIPKELLGTARLCLLPPNKVTAAAVADFFARNRGFMRLAWGERGDEYYTETHWARALEMDAQKQAYGLDIRLWLATQSDEGRVLGLAALHCIERGMFQSAKLSYAVDEIESGKGFATEAARHITDAVGFGLLDLRRVETAILPRNGASIRVAAKAGFIEEGITRSGALLNGAWEDHIRYAKINGDVV